MTAILSCTPTDLYLFNLPFAVHSWKKLGVSCVIFWTMPDVLHLEKMELVSRYLDDSPRVYIEAPRPKAATYAQCSRLYGAALKFIPDNEILVTSDADMCVFSPIFRDLSHNDKVFHVIGHDLVPDGQLPMCYIIASAREWRSAMKIEGRTVQQCVDDLLKGIEADNFRGNYWSKDQEEAHNRIIEYAMNGDEAAPILFHNRAKPGTQFATLRADRDGWPAPIPTDIIDAHLPRPGYLPENFDKIVKLFKTMYPGDDLEWMAEYYNKYIALS